MLYYKYAGPSTRYRGPLIKLCSSEKHVSTTLVRPLLAPMSPSVFVIDLSNFDEDEEEPIGVVCPYVVVCCHRLCQSAH